MAAILEPVFAPFHRLAAIWRAGRQEYDHLEAKALDVYHGRVVIHGPIEKYLIYSTIASLFGTMLLIHKGVDIFAGYPIVVLNTAILLAFNRLMVHRTHIIFIGVLMLVSLVAARRSGTPVFSIMQQIIGILLFSIYYFSMLTATGLTVPQWMKLYCNAALGMAVWAIADYAMRKLHVIHQTNDTRLHWYYSEPSFFVYMTLPAVSLYLGGFLRHGLYRLELGIFAICYVFADSSLGFLGLLVVGFFAFLPRFSLWRLFVFAGLAGGGATAAFFLSTNFRLRVIDTFLGIVSGELQHLNASTFAVLANLYVTIQTFIAHPLIGVGIGGYAATYSKFLPYLHNDDPTIGTLNMFDASSLFFRTAAELGIFGLICLVGFLVVCSWVKGETHVEIRNACLSFFILRMGRYGAYFNVDLYFFVGVFLLNFLNYRQQFRPPRRMTELRNAV